MADAGWYTFDGRQLSNDGGRIPRNDFGQVDNSLFTREADLARDFWFGTEVD